MIGQHRLADLMLIRQMATLTRTVACRSLVVTLVVPHARQCALIERLRAANRCVTCIPADADLPFHTDLPRQRPSVKASSHRQH